jgi:hypothetical protein
MSDTHIKKNKKTKGTQTGCETNGGRREERVGD